MTQAIRSIVGLAVLAEAGRVYWECRSEGDLKPEAGGISRDSKGYSLFERGTRYINQSVNIIDRDESITPKLFAQLFYMSCVINAGAFIRCVGRTIDAYESLFCPTKAFIDSTNIISAQTALLEEQLKEFASEGEKDLFTLALVQAASREDSQWLKEEEKAGLRSAIACDQMEEAMKFILNMPLDRFKTMAEEVMTILKDTSHLQAEEKAAHVQDLISFAKIQEKQLLGECARSERVNESLLDTRHKLAALEQESQKEIDALQQEIDAL